MIPTIAVIGCGKQGQKHVGAIKKIENLNVIVYDENLEIANSLSKRMNVPVIKGFQEVIERKGLVAIDICAPTDSHRDLIIGGLKAGKHIFCEKPLCISLEEAKDIHEVSSRSSLITMVGYHHRFHPAYQLIKEVIDEGIVGSPHFGIFRMGGRGSHQHWKHLKRKGGGALFEIFVHKLTMILWYFGNITRIKWLVNDLVLPKRTIAGKTIEADAEDCVIFQLECESGVQIICEADLVTPCFMDFTEVHGSNGSICGSILHYMPVVVFCDNARGAYNRGNNIFQFPMHDLVKRELEHFVSSIKGEKEPIGGVDESITVMKIIDVLQKNQSSSEKGEWIIL